MTFRLDVFLHDLLGFNFANAAFVTLWVSLLGNAARHRGRDWRWR